MHMPMVPRGSASSSELLVGVSNGQGGEVSREEIRGCDREGAGGCDGRFQILSPIFGSLSYNWRRPIGYKLAYSQVGEKYFPFTPAGFLIVTPP